MLSDFRGELVDLAERVRLNPLLELLAFEIGEPVTGAPPASAIPEPVRHLYATMGSAVLRWRFRPDLDEPTRARIRDEFADSAVRDDMFDVAGAIDIPTLDAVLFDEDLSLPQSEPDGDGFDFDGIRYSDNEFCGMLRPFDVVSEYFAMGFVVRPGHRDWPLMWLSDYWIEYDHSRLVHLEDYLRFTIGTWGLVSARETLFSEYRGDRKPPLTFDADLAASAVPPILRNG